MTANTAPGVAVPESPELAALLQRAREGAPGAPGELFAQHRDRLRRMVELRLDWRLRGRLDASDVLQEAYLEFARSLAGYLQNPEIPFYLWLRFITSRKLHTLHRHHLTTQGRDARRETPHRYDTPLETSADSLAAQLLGGLTTPSQAAVRAELRGCVQAALAGMDPLDREVLALRHFEQLSNGEAAHVLGISAAAASNRFVRALKRLKEILVAVPGLLDGPATADSSTGTADPH
jgi:RNA polymerase sigma-70 factor, ECF subfamily